MNQLRLAFFICAVVSLPSLTYAQNSLSNLEDQILNVFTEKKFAAYQYASLRYLDLLTSIPQAESEEDIQTGRRHLRYMAMVVEPDDPVLNTVDRLLAGDTLSADPLVRWWNRQDPLPQTEINERIQEHLDRIAYATENFGYKKDDRRVDDRGEVFIRLGAPLRNTQIKIVSAGVWLTPYSSRLPDNDLWDYRQIDKEALYLFVRTSPSRPYKVATVEDLIPRDLISSRRRVGLLLTVMEEIFAQLALAHPHYGSTYDALNNYLSVPGSSQYGAYQFGRRMLEKARLDDDLYVRNREEIIPAAFTNALRGADPLEVSLRRARFLEPDGQTRLELYWGIPSSALVPSRRIRRRRQREGHLPLPRYLISFSVASKDQVFATQTIESQYFSLATSARTGVCPQTWTITSEAPFPNLALQWDQRWAEYENEGNSLVAGATLKIGTQILDSLEALNSDPTRLEMSDIRPLFAPDTSDTSPDPYPFSELSPEADLALYFELYHLTFGSDDRASYRVEYRVESAEDSRRSPLAVISDYSSFSRNTELIISLDLSSWDTPGPFRVFVNATDNESGQSVQRSVEFDFVLEDV